MDDVMVQKNVEKTECVGSLSVVGCVVCNAE